MNYKVLSMVYNEIWTITAIDYNKQEDCYTFYMVMDGKEDRSCCCTAKHDEIRFLFSIDSRY